MSEQVIKAKLFDIYMRGLLSNHDEVQSINNNIVRNDDVNEFNHLQTLLDNIKNEDIPNVVEYPIDSEGNKILVEFSSSSPTVGPRNREENETQEAYDQYLENYYTEKFSNPEPNLDSTKQATNITEINNWENITSNLKNKAADPRVDKWLRFACSIMSKNTLSVVELYNIFSQDSNTDTEMPTQVTESNGNRIDQLVTLTSGQKYLVLNQAIYQDRTFYLTTGITTDYKNLDGTFAIFEEFNQEGRTYLKQVTESALLNLLLKYLQPSK